MISHFAIDTEAIENPQNQPLRKSLFGSACPNHRQIKGTQHLIDAVEVGRTRVTILN